MDVAWPSKDGMGSLICDGQLPCIGIRFPTPDPLKPFNFTCSDHWECRNAIINCPTQADCTINCNDRSCVAATVMCPETHHCDITCNGGASCYYVCDIYII